MWMMSLMSLMSLMPLMPPTAFFSRSLAWAKAWYCDVVAQHFKQLFVPHPASDYEAEWPLAVRLSEARVTTQCCRDCKN